MGFNVAKQAWRAHSIKYNEPLRKFKTNDWREYNGIIIIIRFSL
jgi:hypothetical protein